MSPDQGPGLTTRNVLIPFAVVLSALLVGAAFFLGAQEARLLTEQQEELDLAAARLAHRLSGLDDAFHAASLLQGPIAIPERTIEIPIETPDQTRLVDFPRPDSEPPDASYLPPPETDSEQGSSSETSDLLPTQWHIASAGRADATFVLYYRHRSHPGDPERESASDSEATRVETNPLAVPIHLLLPAPTLPPHLDAAVLMTADGRVVYQPALSRLTVSDEDLRPLYQLLPPSTAQSDIPADLSADSPPDPSPLEQRFARTSTTRPREVPRLEISGTTYRPILSPVDLTSLEARPHGSATETLYLCALLKPSTIRRGAAQRAMLSVPAMTVLALLGVALPFLWHARTALRTSPLTPTDVSVAMRTALVTASIATVLTLHYSHDLLPPAHVDQVLRQIAGQIHSEFREELDTAVSFWAYRANSADLAMEKQEFRDAIPDSTPGRLGLQITWHWHSQPGNGAFDELLWGPGHTLPSVAVTTPITHSEGLLARIRTTGTGSFVAALHDPDQPLVLDTYFGSLIHPALPPPVGMAVVDRSGEVLYHSDGHRVLVENYLSRTSDAPDLAQAVQAGSGGLFSARYRGRPQRLLLKPFGSVAVESESLDSLPVPWTLIVFWDQTFVQFHSFHRFAVTLALLGGYALLLLLAGQLLTIFAPQLGWSWKGFAEARDRLRSDAWLYLLPLALVSAIVSMTLEGWQLLAVVTAAALVGYGLLLFLASRKPALPSTDTSDDSDPRPQPSREGAQGPEEELLPPPSRLRSWLRFLTQAFRRRTYRRAYAELRRSPLYPRQFRALLALAVLIIAVFPAIAMFREAHGAVQETAARRLQLAYADSIVSRLNRIEQAKLVTGAVLLDRPTHPLDRHVPGPSDQPPTTPWWPTPLSSVQDPPDTARPDQVLRNLDAPGTLVLSHIAPASYRRLTSSTYSYDWSQTPTATYLHLPDHGITVCSGEGC